MRAFGRDGRYLLIIDLRLTMICLCTQDDVSTPPTSKRRSSTRSTPIDSSPCRLIILLLLFAACCAAADEPEQDPLVQQFLPQLRPLLAGELHLVRVVCRPTPEQYQALKASGNTALADAAKQLAETQKQMQQGFRAGQRPQNPDPRKLIAEALLASVRRTMPAEQAERYRVELAQRAAARKRATVLNLVAKLDKELVLTAAQREQLVKSLDANWQDSWGQQLEIYLYGEQFQPRPPDDQVLPLLTEKQREVWTAMPKNNSTIFFGGVVGAGFVQMVEFPEELGNAALEKHENKKEDPDRAKTQP